jgi:hypothetical protein
MGNTMVAIGTVAVADPVDGRKRLWRDRMRSGLAGLCAGGAIALAVAGCQGMPDPVAPPDLAAFDPAWLSNPQAWCEHAAYPAKCRALAFRTHPLCVSNPERYAACRAAQDEMIGPTR